jgi:hypothetical protein
MKNFAEVQIEGFEQMLSNIKLKIAVTTAAENLSPNMQ